MVFLLFLITVAKKSRHSPDTIEELNVLFPKSCDIMGISTPGIVCKSVSSCHFQSKLFIYPGKNEPAPHITYKCFCCMSIKALMTLCGLH